MYFFFIEINLCDPDPCLNGANCSNFRTSFDCACPTGYQGMICEGNHFLTSTFPFISNLFIAYSVYFCNVILILWLHPEQVQFLYIYNLACIHLLMYNFWNILFCVDENKMNKIYFLFVSFLTLQMQLITHTLCFDMIHFFSIWRLCKRSLSEWSHVQWRKWLLQLSLCTWLWRRSLWKW